MLRKTIYIGADAAGYVMKEGLVASLREEGYDVIDCGTDSPSLWHYPELAHAVCVGVQKAPHDSFGILICGTGIGMSIAANKHRGIRAALCSEPYSARCTRIHNDANVLCMGARVIGTGIVGDIVDLFLNTEFESGGRHEQRVDMITAIETNECLK